MDINAEDEFWRKFQDDLLVEIFHDLFYWPYNYMPLPILPLL